MNLIKLSELQLNDIFIYEVVKFRRGFKSGEMLNYWYDEQDRPRLTEMPNYCLSLNDLLPFLERAGWACASNRAGLTAIASVALANRHGADIEISCDNEQAANPLCKAGVAALILLARQAKSLSKTLAPVAAKV